MRTRLIFAVLLLSCALEAQTTVAGGIVAVRTPEGIVYTNLVPAARPAPTAPLPPGSHPLAPNRRRIRRLLHQAAQRYALDPRLVFEVARQESDLDPRSVSRKGAMGVMQLMPATARAMGVRDPFNAAQNIAGGARYLRTLLRLYGGNVRLSLAAYNAGPGAVARFGDTIPPYRETRSYVRVITQRLRRDGDPVGQAGSRWRRSGGK